MCRAFQCKLDQEKGAQKKSQSSTRAAFSKFQQSDKMGTSNQSATDAKLKTKHQNAIRSLEVMEVSLLAVQDLGLCSYAGRV